MLIDEFIFGNTALLPTIWDYVHAQAKLQTVSNPSGTFLPQGLGLGEPKFQVDGTRFNGAWGRPQRDGPALRAIALMTFSNWLIENGQSSTAKTIIWPIISNDLSKYFRVPECLVHTFWDGIARLQITKESSCHSAPNISGAQKC
jgi:glucoamylase